MSYWKPYTKTAARKSIDRTIAKSCPMPAKATKEDVTAVLTERVRLLELALAAIEEELAMEGMGGFLYCIISFVLYSNSC